MAETRMNAQPQVIYVVLFLSCGLIHTSLSCSPDNRNIPRSLTELTILAPVVIVGKVLNTSVPSDMQQLTHYSACFIIEQVIKGDKLQIAQTFCTKYFGGDAICLSQVDRDYTYVLYLNSDLSARYDNHFSAAIRATDAIINFARKGYCNVRAANVSSCVPPTIIDNPKRSFVVEEAMNLILNCNMVGTKPYVVTWQFKGKGINLPYESRVGYDGTLSLYGLSQSYGGRYTCVVQNAAGMTSQDIRVFVNTKPCGAMLMVKNRSHISSPNFPNQYPPDKTCAWRFCPPPGKRVKFTFNNFFLQPLDSILIDNECMKSLNSWRTYCGSISPGTFVSDCPTGCVQLRLLSRVKTGTYHPFTGMNFTVEPTSEESTPKFDVFKHYCASDIVIKGKLIGYDSWSGLKIKAVESFKKPHKGNKVYVMEYRGKDSYGCYDEVRLLKDRYFFGVMENGVFKIKATIPDDAPGTATGSGMVKQLRKYKDMIAPCIPPPPQ